MKKLFVVYVLSVMVLGCKQDGPTVATDSVELSGARASSKPAGAIAARVDGARARALVEAGAILLDVRSPAEFSSGHIDGAKNIPVQELANRIKEVGAFDAPVVIYCHSGMRSATATAMLSGAGYTELYDLGAMSSW